MSDLRYNYTSINRIKQPWDVEASPRPLHQKGEFLMNPNDITPPEFINLKPRTKDLTGERFARLVALGPVSLTPSGVFRWLCQCDCGNMSIVQADNLRSGGTRSCGCYIREVTSRRSKTHGLSKTSEYIIWMDIIRRCTDPSRPSFKSYGGRGIVVCDEWLHDFAAFHAYVTGLPHYGENGYTLDRINNNGNYEPGNVRWATVKEQSRNTRANHLLTFDGRTRCVTEWAEELGLKAESIFSRLKLGWTTERALTQVPRYSLRSTKKKIVGEMGAVEKAGLLNLEVV